MRAAVDPDNNTQASNSKRIFPVKTEYVHWRDRNLCRANFSKFYNEKLGKTFEFYALTMSVKGSTSFYIKGTSERLGNDFTSFRVTFKQPVEKSLYISMNEALYQALTPDDETFTQSFLGEHTSMPSTQQTTAIAPGGASCNTGTFPTATNRSVRARIDPRYVTEFEDPEKVKKLKITLRCFDPRTNPKIFHEENSVNVDDCHPSEPWTFTFSKDNYNVDGAFYVHFTATCYKVSKVKARKKSIVCHPSDQFVTHIAVFYRRNVQNEFKFYRFQFLTADDTLPQGSYYPSKEGTGEILFFSYDPWLFKRLLISELLDMVFVETKSDENSVQRISYARASEDYYELDYRTYSDDFRAPSPPIAEIGSRFDMLSAKGEDTSEFASKINKYFRVKHYDPREYYTIPTMSPNSPQCYEKWEGSGLTTKELEDLSFYLKYSFETSDYKQILNCRDGEIFVTAASKGRNQYCGISLCFNIFRSPQDGQQSKKCEMYKKKIEAAITKITKTKSPKNKKVTQLEK